jgi:hypothetical protein
MRLSERDPFTMVWQWLSVLSALLERASAEGSFSPSSVECFDLGRIGPSNLLIRRSGSQSKNKGLPDCIARKRFPTPYSFRSEYLFKAAVPLISRQI